MASGLAATIQDRYGLEARLVEGHDGIYEVRVDGEVLYTNQEPPGGLPEEAELLTLLEGRGAEPRGAAAAESGSDASAAPPPSCEWRPD